MNLKTNNWPYPYLNLRHEGGYLVHFAHANGYPPEAYRALITKLNSFSEIYAMEARPLWPGYKPEDIHTWEPFGSDLHNFLKAKRNDRKWVGVGHSIGGTATIMAAIKQPDLFQAIVVIDPPFFSPNFSRIWNLIYLAGLAYRLHPLASGALRRKRTFPSIEDMMSNYRKKKVFRHFSDRVLSDYVNAMAISSPNGDVNLCYSPEWEARIYVTSARFDPQIWRSLSKIKIPILVIRGSENPTFWTSTLRQFKRALPHTEFIDVSEATHLLPLEKPEITADLIQDFLTRNSIG